MRPEAWKRRPWTLETPAASHKVSFLMRSLSIFLICVAPVVWAQSAQARSKSKSSEAPELMARKACAEGDFQKGVSILADIYVRSKEPTHIFNQGRCYEQNHQWVSAIDRFREYLRKATGLTPNEVKDTDNHIAECKRLLEEEESRNAPPPAPPPAPYPPPQPVPSPEPLQPTSPPVRPPEHASAGAGGALRTTGIVVGSVGVAAVAAGVLLNLKANQLANDGDASGQKTYQNGSLVCYGVGGAAVAAGVILYWLGHRAGSKPSTGIVVFPTWTPGGAALAFSGGF